MKAQTRYHSALIFLFLLLAAAAPAQHKVLHGQIRDSHSEETVPFASVQFKNSTMGVQADSSGHFTFHLSNWPSDTLEVSCVGYQPYLVLVPRNKDSVELNIELERGTFSEGAVVRVKVNKGLLLWKKIVQHKPENDRYRFENFSYELYNKLELDLKNINFEKFSKFKPLRPVTQLISQNIDTEQGLKYLPSYLTEVISDYYYQKKPLKRREVIKAVNTNGVKNESFSKLLGGMDQNVNIYNNFIPVFDKEFVSPASDNGDYYYNYRVVDTQKINNQRFFHLVFTPRRNSAVTFEGDCWVHAGSFAIQKMNLRLGKDADVNFMENLSMIQEYKMINDSTWFLAKDKFVADMSPMGKDKPGFIGRKTTTYQNIRVNDTSVINELAKNKIQEEVITLPGSDEKSKEFWAGARHEDLSRTEAGIIKMIDTLTHAPVFQKFTKTLDFIGTGYKTIGNYQIGPWMNWISYNGWEGWRFRFDVNTNHHFNHKITFHTYLAYGTKDQKLKGMADFFYLPHKSPRIYLYGAYTHDLDWGQNYYGEVSQDNIFSLAIRKQGVPVKNISVDEKRLEFFLETTPWMSGKLTFSHKATTALRNLLPADSFATGIPGKPFTNFEVALRLRFAWLEKFLENSFYRSSLGSPYPIGEFTISRGFSGFLNSSYKYTKLHASISDYMKIPPYGSISWNFYGGKTIGTLPYPFLDIAPGNELYYYNKYAFNLMNRWEFIHDRYIGINIDHNIGSGLFHFFPKIKARQFWTFKSLWGWLSDANRALNFKTGNSFQTLDGKPYIEAGTGVDNIFHVFRIDFIWRLHPTTLPKKQDKPFGVFGSFRLTF